MLRTGIDLIEVERIARAVEKYGDRFLERIFTSEEITESRGSVEALAAKFAGKEAVSKALGTGISNGIRWIDIEILHHRSGAPYLVLHGNANKIASIHELTTWSISLTHTKEIAAAMVVAM